MKVELVHSVDKGNIDEDVVLKTGRIKKKVKLNGSLRMNTDNEGVNKTSLDIKDFRGIERDDGEIRVAFGLKGKRMGGKEIKEMNLNFQNETEFRGFIESLKSSRS